MLGGFSRGSVAPALGGLGRCTLLLSALLPLLSTAPPAAFGEPGTAPAAGLLAHPVVLSFAALIFSPSPFSRYALGSGGGEACLQDMCSTACTMHQ